MPGYAIRGGKEGKERLNLLARVMRPTTSQLLNKVDLKKGMNCLDMGCGGGHVTLLMASMVGPSGKVIGTDTDREILALAREDAEAANLDNVEFRQADASLPQWHREYDLVYARFLLSHLSEPQSCLEAMVDACKHEGTIVIEDTDCSGNFSYPPFAAYERFVGLYQKVIQRRGGDPNIGPKLPGMLRHAGAKEIEISVFQPAHIQGEGKLMARMTMERIGDAVISEGLATQSEVQQIINDLDAAAVNAEIVMSQPRIFQVWGKPSRSD
jgi:SAM-dependent methyltransferase